MIFCGIPYVYWNDPIVFFVNICVSNDVICFVEFLRRKEFQRLLRNFSENSNCSFVFLARVIFL